MRITAVRAVVAPETPPPEWIVESVVANPMSIYPAHAERRGSWLAGFPNVVVEIETDAGVHGLGVAVGGAATAALIEGHLARLLVGEDPGDVERLWDQMFRATLPYGRRGLPIMAISGVDAALWDVLGKAAGVPVYRLLGGACRDDLPIYQTSNDPADWGAHEGLGIKLAMPYGPAAGREGMRANAALVEACRAATGDGAEIMLDCFMGWDVEYTRRMIDRVEPFDVRWIEEPLPPDDYRGYERLGAVDTPVAIATGEHEYTRWGFATLIETGGVTILQPDVDWVGGITEARRICALASCHHLTVVPHGGALQATALHLMKSQVNTPIAEWVRDADSPVLGVPEPVAGRIAPPETPGLGLRLP